MKTKTELHTHLMGMLSAQGFMNLLCDFNYCFPINKNGQIDFDSTAIRRISVNNFLKDKRVFDKLYIPKGKKVDYSELNEFYTFRNTLIGDLVAFVSSNTSTIDAQEIKYKIYAEYFNESLKELIGQGVEYVEISYSNAKIIDNIFKYADVSLLDQIKCSFLFSTDREKVAKDFRQSSRRLAELIDKGLSVGFDIMGAELPLLDSEIDENNKQGLIGKLTPLIETLNKWNNTTLRIHSGETRYSRENTQKILTLLEKIEEKLGITIPPPQIRIGHGIYFEKNQEYLRLMKKFKCIVEINASSNYALDNIDEYSDIPYNYYLDNGIPIVISSDGHGLYDTSKQEEDKIASSIVKKDNQNKIEEFDKKIIKKGGV